MQINRLAFIGVRGHTSTVLSDLPNHPDVRVVGACDGGAEPIDAIRNWCLQNDHRPNYYDDYRRLFDDANPQAVVICGPFELHTQMAIDAVRRGIHVIIEKPAALTFDDLHRLADLHAEHPHVHLTSLQTARYNDTFFTAWRLVRDGAIGDVRLVNARKSYKFGTRGAFYRHRETYGGTIPWVGSHAIDWMLWIGGHAVRTAFAAHSAVANSGAGSMESSAVCQFGLCGERFATISLDMLRPANARTHGDDWLRVVGTTGVIEVTANNVQLTNDSNDGRHPVPLLNAPSLLEDFIAHIAGRRPSLNPTDDVLATTAACLLARQAADEHRVIEADELTSVRIKSLAAIKPRTPVTRSIPEVIEATPATA